MKTTSGITKNEKGYCYNGSPVKIYSWHPNKTITAKEGKGPISFKAAVAKAAIVFSSDVIGAVIKDVLRKHGKVNGFTIAVRNSDLLGAHLNPDKPRGTIIGITACSKLDSFNGKLGRTIALNKLVKIPITITKVADTRIEYTIWGKLPGQEKKSEILRSIPRN